MAAPPSPPVATVTVWRFLCAPCAHPCARGYARSADGRPAGRVRPPAARGIQFGTGSHGVWTGVGWYKRDMVAAVGFEPTPPKRDMVATRCLNLNAPCVLCVTP